MIKINGYESYKGGKSGDGTYQTLINHIPPHRVYYSLYAGNCGVTRHKKLAEMNIVNDIDPLVCQAWIEHTEQSDFIITNRPALDILQDLTKANLSKEVFIYLDPPYRMKSRRSEKKIYRFEMTDTDHVLLLEQITAMPQVNIMISHYPDEMYDMYLHEWHTHDFYSKTRNGMALERIYYNYELTGQLHDYSFIGKDFRQRERINRIKKNFMLKLDKLTYQEQQLILIDFFEKYSNRDGGWFQDEDGQWLKKL